MVCGYYGIPSKSKSNPTPSVYFEPPLTLSEMLTIAEIRSIIANICILANALISSVPSGSKKDKIWAVMSSNDGKTPYKTFNKKFDAMFDKDCCDLHGHLHHLHCRKPRIGLVCSYLTNLDWTDIFLNLSEIKLQHLLVELRQL